MLDDILDFFNRRSRQHETERAPTRRTSGRPIDLPFFEDGDDDDARDRLRQANVRRSSRQPSSNRPSRNDDWF